MWLQEKVKSQRLDDLPILTGLSRQTGSEERLADWIQREDPGETGIAAELRKLSAGTLKEFEIMLKVSL